MKCSSISIPPSNDEETKKMISDFHKHVAKITGMLIDKDTFNNEEIIELI